MIKIEIDENFNWKDMISNIKSKGYRKTKNGRYEAFCSVNCKNISLGTHDTIEQAQESVLNHRINRFLNNLKKYDLNANDGIVFNKKYIVFKNGMIFNIHGEKMIGSINRDGYIHGNICNKNVSFHRIVASAFCNHEHGKDYVNHIDGNKQNNASSNLEWVTKSENTMHSFKTGLQNNIAGVPVYTIEEKNYIREHCFENYKEIASHLNRNPETVRNYIKKYRKEFRNNVKNQ